LMNIIHQAFFYFVNHHPSFWLFLQIGIPRLGCF
jgi:hypothetical protein